MPMGTAERLDTELGLQVREFAFSTATDDRTVVEGGDTGAVIAAIFEALQRIDHAAGDRLRSDDPDNPTHDSAPFLCRFARQRPIAQCFGVARLVDLARPAEGHRAFWHVLGDDAARGGVSTIADGHRRDQ